MEFAIYPKLLNMSLFGKQKGCSPYGCSLLFKGIEVEVQLKTRALHLQIFHFQLRGKGLLVVALSGSFVQGVG